MDNSSTIPSLVTDLSIKKNGGDDGTHVTICLLLTVSQLIF